MDDNQDRNESILPPHGGYRSLLSFQKAEIIYDGTVHFTGRFLDRYDRTIGQMVQAARSGKQNIAEASVASGTSKETEIKLTNVARASLEELLLDYEDFLRTRKLLLWDKQHPYAIRIRDLNRHTPNANYDTFRKAIEHQDPEISGNTLITLIKITTWLLRQQIKRLEADFHREGGITERLSRIRKENTRGQD